MFYYRFATRSILIDPISLIRYISSPTNQIRYPTLTYSSNLIKAATVEHHAIHPAHASEIRRAHTHTHESDIPSTFVRLFHEPRFQLDRAICAALVPRVKGRLSFHSRGPPLLGKQGQTRP